MTTTERVPAVTSQRAFIIAMADAERAYRRTEHFKIEIKLEDDGWHIDFEIKDPFSCGGGPHYIIDATTGTITWKRYDQ